MRVLTAVDEACDALADEALAGVDIRSECLDDAGEVASHDRVLGGS